MLKNTLGRLRLVALCEGISYVLLLGIAMPLKYLYDRPEAVRITGMLHGILFILLALALYQTHRRRQVHVQAHCSRRDSRLPPHCRAASQRAE